MGIKWLVVIIAAVALYVYFYLRRLEKSNAPSIIVRLDELSATWLKYNETVSAPVKEDGMDILFGGDTEDDEAPKDEIPVESEVAAKEDASPDPEEVLKEEPRVTAPVDSTEEASDVLFSEFINKVVGPHKKAFESQKAVPVLRKIAALLEKHGHNPSVVTDSKDSESVELYTVRDNLAGISLSDHTTNVVKAIMEIVRETYRDYENFVPKAVVTALAHDLGKIPELRTSGIYNTREHHLIGALKIKELGEGMNVPWLDDAVKAIREHHMPSNDQFSSILRQADRKARELELLKFSKTHTIMPLHNWFDPEKFIDSIEPRINHIKSGGKWDAFMHKGVVYMQPDFVYEAAKNMCREAKVIDLMFVHESERDNAMGQLVGILRQAGFIPDTLPGNRYARRFEVSAATGKKKFMLTPLVADRINTEEIKGRATGYLTSITGVTAK